MSSHLAGWKENGRKPSPPDPLLDLSYGIIFGTRRPVEIRKVCFPLALGHGLLSHSTAVNCVFWVLEGLGNAPYSDCAAVVLLGPTIPPGTDIKCCANAN